VDVTSVDRENPEKLTSEALRYSSHSFYTTNTPYLAAFPRKRSPDGVTTDSSHLIAAYYRPYSFIIWSFKAPLFNFSFL